MLSIRALVLQVFQGGLDARGLIGENSFRPYVDNIVVQSSNGSVSSNASRGDGPPGIPCILPFAPVVMQFQLSMSAWTMCHCKNHRQAIVLTTRRPFT